MSRRFKFAESTRERSTRRERVEGEQSMQHLHDEIDVLKLRSTNFEKRFQDTNSRALRYLDEQTDDTKVKNCLKNLWNNNCKREESITHDIWKSKEDFLRSIFDKEKSEEIYHTIILGQDDSENDRDKPQSHSIDTNFQHERPAYLNTGPQHTQFGQNQRNRQYRRPPRGDSNYTRG